MRYMYGDSCQHGSALVAGKPDFVGVAVAMPTSGYHQKITLASRSVAFGSVIYCIIPLRRGLPSLRPTLPSPTPLLPYP